MNESKSMTMQDADQLGKLNCVDCGVHTGKINEYYMVSAEIWQKAGLEQLCGCACIGCLETRIGRRLHYTDFIPCVLNCDLRQKRSERLQERLPPLNMAYFARWWWPRGDIISWCEATTDEEKCTVSVSGVTK